MIKNIKKSNSGFLLIEIIIAIALISTVFITLLGVGVLVINVSGTIQKQTQADSLIKDELEALRNFRDGTTWATNGLGVINTGSSNPYHMVINSNKWTIVSGAETAGIFTRKIIFDDVSRDASGNIDDIYNVSRNDADTIKVTVVITWLDKTIQNIMYLTNWKQ